MKHVLLLFSVLVLLAGLTWFVNSATGNNTKAPLSGIYREKKTAAPSPDLEKLRAKAVTAKSFVHKKKYNEETCFFIDMSRPPGKNRFFIYDLKKDSLLRAGLVTHGNCYQYWLEGRKYSNAVGSGCTSLGKYRVGVPYTGKWGYSYKLHGLDSSNNKAFERAVVLHGHSCVPSGEVEEDICQSNGCPTVAPDFLEQLKALINASPKPVLLWIYE
ncbi:MAG: murein L,D-transpeptidase catalytic domain family protein [Sphingobacteriales bacterium]|nr:murein L,D-transpeptidase catalytic domain family protein [Sphingobacteriales bacterium]